MVNDILIKILFVLKQIGLPAHFFFSFVITIITIITMFMVFGKKAKYSV